MYKAEPTTISFQQNIPCTCLKPRDFDTTRCTILVPVTVINTTTKSNLQRRGFIWLTGNSIPLRKVRAGTQTGTWRQELTYLLLTQNNPLSSKLSMVFLAQTSITAPKHHGLVHHSNGPLSGTRVYVSCFSVLWFILAYGPEGQESIMVGDIAANHSHVAEAGKLRAHSFWKHKVENKWEVNWDYKILTPSPVIHFLQEGRTSPTVPPGDQMFKCLSL